MVAAAKAPVVTQVWLKAPDDSVGQPCQAQVSSAGVRHTDIPGVVLFLLGTTCAASLSLRCTSPHFSDAWRWCNRQQHRLGSCIHPLPFTLSHTC